MLESTAAQLAPNAAPQNAEQHGDLVYREQSKLGKLQFICDSQRHLGVGRLEACDDANEPFMDGVVYTVPGYVPDATKDKVWKCRSAKDGKAYRFTGRMVPYAPAVKPLPSAPQPLVAEKMALATADVDPAPLDVIAMTQSGCSSVKPAATPAGRGKRSQRAIPANYAVELERIGLARAAGLDPDVRMEFMILFLNESRANLYRKMELTPPQFPKPVKRGRGSFWPFSVVEAYRSGKGWEVSHG